MLHPSWHPRRLAAPPSRPWLVLSLLAVAGLLLRIAVARPDTFPSVDGVFYLIQSRDLVLHNRLTFSPFPPGWPVLAALPLYLMDATDPVQVFRAAQGLNVVLGVLGPILAFLVLRRELGPWPAVAAAGVLLALPALVISAKGDLTEPSYGCVLLLALLLSDRDELLTGLTLGCAYLFRPEALLILAGFAVALGWRGRRVPWALLAGAAVPVVPYVLYLHHHTGAWTVTGKMGVLTAAWSEGAADQLPGSVRRNLAAILGQLPGLVGWPLVVLAAVGLVGRPRRAHLALLALLPLPLFTFVMAGRFWLPYLPIVVLAAGAGAQLVVGRVAPRRRLVVSVALAVACGAGLAGAARDDVFWVTRNPNAYVGLRDAGEWLRPWVGPETKVAAYKPFVGFWAGCGFVKYPAGVGTSDLLDGLAAEGVTYLVVNRHVARLLVPPLQPLLQTPLDPAYADRVRLVAAFRYTPDDHSTFVLRLLPRTGP